MDPQSRIIYPQDAVQGAEMTQDIAPPQPPVAPTNQQPSSEKPGKRLWLWVVLGVFAVGAIASGSFYYYKHSHQSAKKVVIDKKCSDDLLQKSATNLNPSNALQLKVIVDKIKSIQGYESDPNCLNVITTYYINISDPNNAQTYFDKLQKVYSSNNGPNMGFSSSLGVGVHTMIELQNEVNALKTEMDQTIQNAKKLNSVGGSKR